MGGIRVRWPTAGKAALVALAALLALKLLPALLKPPEPPPLGADVGLPRVAVKHEAELEPAVTPPKERRPSPGPRQPEHGRRSVRIGSRPKPHRRRKVAEKPAAPTIPAPVSTPPPAPPPTPPPPPPAPAPVAPPTPAPQPTPTPDDGSAEFAPH